MPRKTETPVDAQHPQIATDLARADQLTGQLAEISQQFGDGLPYDRIRLVNETRFYMAQSAEAMLEAGKRLVVLKEHEAHGEFTQIVEQQLGIERRVAQRMMQAAVKFLDPKRSSLSVLGKSKLYELMVLDNDELEALAEGGTVAGLDQDEIDRMSARELRAALRKERERRQLDSDTTDKLLSAKDKKINALDKQLTETLRSGPLVKPWREEVAAINAEVANYGLGATECIAKLAEIHGALPALELSDPDAPQDTAQHAIVHSLHDSLSRLASQLGALQQALYDEFQHIIDAPRFDLMAPATAN